MAYSGLSPDMLEPAVVASVIDVFLAQAGSLERLRRTADRERKLKVAMSIATDCFKAHRDSALAILNAARVANAAGQLEDAARWLSAGHKLKGDQTTKHNIQYEETLVARARAVGGSPEALPEDFIIYVCQKCGRLIEYVSLPCMCCGWRPTTLFEMSHSGCLNNRIFSLWDLLVIGREIAAGRKATDVVPKLAQVAAKKMADPQSRQDIEIVFQTAEKKFDTFFFWHDAAVCENCGTHNPRQDAKECQKCKGRLRLSPPLRLLMCLTRTLDHFQGSFEAPKSKEFDLFIRFLVTLQSKLYRTQETPSHHERIQVLDLMSKLARFELSNGIAEIIMTNPHKISSHLRDGLPDEQKPHAITVLADFTNTLQFLADWMSRTKGLS